MSRFLQLCTSSLGRKYIMALTGLLLGSFLGFHAAGNSLIVQSRAAFAAYAGQLRSLGLLLPAAGLLLAAVFLLHIVTGISLVLRNRKAKPERYAVRASLTGLRGWLARIMPCSGAGVLAFLLLHLATVRFADQAVPVADRVSRVLADPLLAALYAAGIASLGLHLSHGFWSLTQTLGLHHPSWNGLIKAVSCLAGLLLVGIFEYIVLLHVAGLR